MDYQVFATALIGFIVLYSVWKRYARPSIADIAGPDSHSFVYGVSPELHRGDAANADFKWFSQYGKVVRVRGPIGLDYLLVSDPKALQYILHTSGYRFPKDPTRLVLAKILTGKGLVTVDGDVHKRQRKVMLPGFQTPETRSYTPLFLQIAAKVTSKWSEALALSDNQSAVIDVYYWFSRAALDAIGEAAFDYHFGALDDQENELAKAYNNVLFDTFKNTPRSFDLVMTLAKLLPVDMYYRILTMGGKSSPLAHAISTTDLAMRVAKQLVDQKADALREGTGNKDILSLLVKANASENPKTRLKEKELLAQMQIIMFAGHETTANTTAWTLHELSKRPDIQTKLRSEIRAYQKRAAQHGDGQLAAKDLEEMPYLNAVTKETLRLNAVVFRLERQAQDDDVIPLSEPIVTTSGKTMHEIPVPKGQHIFLSLAAYNRSPEIFGQDADVFNPDRWLKETSTVNVTSPVGVFANLLTFSGGLRACIGWRFAVLELQSFLVETVGNYEFFPTPKSERVKHHDIGVMAPTVEGEVDKGVQLPLRVKVASREEDDGF